jgi:uncharacterized damage-inducible protein DinB
MKENEKTTEEMLTEFCALPDRLEAAIERLTEEELDAVRGEDKWSIRQIVHHIVDSDTLVRTLIEAALGNSGCTYDQGWYDTDNAWAETLDYANRSLAPAVLLFRASHLHLEELLRRLPAPWEKYVHLKWEKEPEGRKVSVRYLIQGRIHHTLHHLEQIRATRKVHGF